MVVEQIGQQRCEKIAIGRQGPAFFAPGVVCRMAGRRRRSARGGRVSVLDHDNCPGAERRAGSRIRLARKGWPVLRQDRRAGACARRSWRAWPPATGSSPRRICNRAMAIPWTRARATTRWQVSWLAGRRMGQGLPRPRVVPRLAQWLCPSHVDGHGLPHTHRLQLQGQPRIRNRPPALADTGPHRVPIQALADTSACTGQGIVPLPWRCVRSNRRPCQCPIQFVSVQRFVPAWRAGALQRDLGCYCLTQMQSIASPCHFPGLGKPIAHGIPALWLEKCFGDGPMFRNGLSIAGFLLILILENM
jgi:hypothetical protein